MSPPKEESMGKKEREIELALLQKRDMCPYTEEGKNGRVPGFVKRVHCASLSRM